jgi:hypothetical protein
LNVFDKVTVAYRGVNYEIGRGRDFYGIWTAGGPRSQPLERWPEAPDGWSAAWARFTELEEPGTIAPAGRNAPRAAHAGPGGVSRLSPTVSGSGSGVGAVGAALLLGAGIALGIAGLFPDYLAGSSLATEPAQLIPHVIYLATWTASAALILMGGARLRAGALLGSGLSVVTLGLFLADAGTPIAGGAHLAGAGLWLSLAGWLACAAGSAMAFLLRPAGPLGADAGDAAPRGSRGRLRMPTGAALGPAILLVLSGLGVAVAFAPAWDSYTLRTAAGQTQYLTAGNAFSNPGPVIVGDVIAMVAFALVIFAAAAWRPARHGAILLAGAIIPMAAQAISALVQVGEATPPQQFGLTPAQASQLGLTISNGLTPAFWIYCVFGVALAVSCLWMLFTPQAQQAPHVAQEVYAMPGDARAQEAGAQGDAYGWKPDAYAWYAAAPDTTGLSGPATPMRAAAEMPQAAPRDAAAEMPQAAPRDAAAEMPQAAPRNAAAEAPKADDHRPAAENDQAS